MDISKLGALFPNPVKAQTQESMTKVSVIMIDSITINMFRFLRDRWLLQLLKSTAVSSAAQSTLLSALSEVFCPVASPTLLSLLSTWSSVDCRYTGASCLQSSYN